MTRRTPGGWVLAAAVLSGACGETEQTPGARDPEAQGRGARVPWVEYQAEDGRTRRDAVALEAEAVGRKAVRLDTTGDFVAITARAAANAIVVRLAIPEAPTGGGLDATLGLYVDGQRVRSLAVTSRYTWADPGEPHASFDETRARVSVPIREGAEVMLRKDAEDTAAFYVVDLIDLEQVDAPLERPVGLLSITDFDATPDDDTDDREAIQRALDVAARDGRGGVWIPRGTFRVASGEGLSLQGLALRGAGMWHSTLQGPRATLSCEGEGGCRFSDFSLFGEGAHRDDAAPVHGFHGGLGRDSVIENVWVEHLRTGIWSGVEGAVNATDGLVVKGSRFRDLAAGGVHFVHGTCNSVVEHSHFRNTGGDALSLGSQGQAGGPPEHDNVLRHNGVQLPWRGGCFALHGGHDNALEDSTCEDVLTGPGLRIDRTPDAHPFGPTTHVTGLTLTRAGGTASGENHGALCFSPRSGPVNDILVEDVDIVDPTFAGLQFQDADPGQDARLSDVVLRRVSVTGAGTYGIEVGEGTRGEVRFEDVRVKDSAREALHAPGVPDSFFQRLAGNLGW